jgi:hypothetical protein
MGAGDPATRDIAEAERRQQFFGEERSEWLAGDAADAFTDEVS